jgi:hypothetical protein
MTLDAARIFFDDRESAVAFAVREGTVRGFAR